jgi:hypothetical protein
MAFGSSLFCQVGPSFFGLRDRLGETGEFVFVIYGLTVPVILSTTDPDYSIQGFRYVEEAYVDGIMKGKLRWRLGEDMDNLAEEIDLY